MALPHPLGRDKLAAVAFPSPGGSQMLGTAVSRSPVWQMWAVTLIAAEGGGWGPGHV